MTLAELPYNTVCAIRHVGEVVRDSTYAIGAGLRSGAHVRVLARFPETEPKLLEVEVGGLVVSIPLGIANDVKMECA